MSSEQERQQFEGLYGPLASGDYELGAVIRYRADGQIKRGEIVWRYGAGQTVSGAHHPLTYVVDPGAGFPDLVYSTDIVL